LFKNESEKERKSAVSDVEAATLNATLPLVGLKIFWFDQDVQHVRENQQCDDK
jgi:hypothetical protein